MSIAIKKGDILESQEDYIIQQCNCLTVRSHGLSASIEEKWPYAAIYSKRKAVGSRNLAVVKDRAVPGTFSLATPDEQLEDMAPTIVCLFGQWRPGRIDSSYFSYYPECPAGSETIKKRLTWFKSALDSFAEYIIAMDMGKKVSVAVPYNIGCGLAGGKWSDYLRALSDFQDSYKKYLTIVLYRLE